MDVISGRSQRSNRAPTWPADFPGEEVLLLRRRRLPISPPEPFLRRVHPAPTIRFQIWCFSPGGRRMRSCGGWCAMSRWTGLIMIYAVVIVILLIGWLCCCWFVCSGIFFFEKNVGGWFGLVFACGRFVLDWCFRVSCSAMLIVVLGVVR